jgi:hypothetical protein
VDKPTLNPLIIGGIVVASLVVAAVGWLLLDRLLNPYLATEGTRAQYQEASREDIMAQPVAFLGADRCADCHSEIQQEWLHSAHSAVICEDCHDPGREHVDSAVQMTTNASSSLCLNCHMEIGARPAAFPQVTGDVHSLGLPCLQCHDPMHPEIGAGPTRTHQYYEGMDCMICHGVGTFQPMPVDHEARTLETCGRCHEEEGL